MGEDLRVKTVQEHILDYLSDKLYKEKARSCVDLQNNPWFRSLLCSLFSLFHAFFFFIHYLFVWQQKVNMYKLEQVVGSKSGLSQKCSAVVVSPDQFFFHVCDNNWIYTLLPTCNRK